MNSISKINSAIACINLSDENISHNNRKYLSTPKDKKITKNKIKSSNKNIKNNKSSSNNIIKPQTSYKKLQHSKPNSKEKIQIVTPFANSVKHSTYKSINFSDKYINNIKEAFASNDNKKILTNNNTTNIKRQNNFISYFPNYISRAGQNKVRLIQKTQTNEKDKKNNSSIPNKQRHSTQPFLKGKTTLKNYFIHIESISSNSHYIKDTSKGILTDVSRNIRLSNNTTSSNRTNSSIKQKIPFYAFSLCSSKRNPSYQKNNNKTNKNNINIIKSTKQSKPIIGHKTNINHLKKNQKNQKSQISLKSNNNIKSIKCYNINSIYHYSTQNGSLTNSISSMTKPLTSKNNIVFANSYENFSFSTNIPLRNSMRQKDNNNLKYINNIKVNQINQTQSSFSSKYVNTINNIIKNTRIASNKKIIKRYKKVNYYSPHNIISKYRKYLTTKEINELRNLESKVFYIGEISERKSKFEYSYINLNKSMCIPNRKIKVNSRENSYSNIQIKKRNNSYCHIRNKKDYGLEKRIDDKEGDYILKIGDHIKYRYEIITILGKGSYGEAVKCLDHKTNEYVCIKIIKSMEKFQSQAKIEIKILEHIKSHDKLNQYNIVKFYSYFIFRGHICIVFELLDISLYDYIKSRNYNGIELKKIRKYTTEILFSLLFLKKNNIIHCDLKPENILLLRSDNSKVKVIDFGSSCFDTEKLYLYIQSRFYRAPEIILEQGYDTEIDMWSLGCILCELYNGVPIFPGEDERDELFYMMEYLGVPSNRYINLSRKKRYFFDEENKPLQIPNSNGKLRLPKTKSVYNFLKGAGEVFIDFVKRCLRWDPGYRMTPEEGLMHKFICGEMNYEEFCRHKERIWRVKVGEGKRNKRGKSKKRNASSWGKDNKGESEISDYGRSKGSKGSNRNKGVMRNLTYSNDMVRRRMVWKFRNSLRNLGYSLGNEFDRKKNNIMVVKVGIEG